MTAALTPPAWVEDGLCAQVDPALFFPEQGSKTTPLAKRVCAACPVRTQCAEYALADPDLVGIWGGTTDKQRKKARRKAGYARPLSPIKHGTPAGERAHRRRGEGPCEACLQGSRIAQRERRAQTA